MSTDTCPRKHHADSEGKGPGHERQAHWRNVRSWWQTFTLRVRQIQTKQERIPNRADGNRCNDGVQLARFALFKGLTKQTEKTKTASLECQAKCRTDQQRDRRVRIDGVVACQPERKHQQSGQRAECEPDRPKTVGCDIHPSQQSCGFFAMIRDELSPYPKPCRWGWRLAHRLSCRIRSTNRHTASLRSPEFRSARTTCGQRAHRCGSTP